MNVDLIGKATTPGTFYPCCGTTRFAWDFFWCQIISAKSNIRWRNRKNLVCAAWGCCL